MRFLVMSLLLGMTAQSAEVQVTVYDRAGLAGHVKTTTLRTAERILSRAGLEVQWRDGSLDSEEAALITYPESPRKGREQEASCAARRDIALEILPSAPAGLSKSVLGSAQPMARQGLNVRVFDERVRVTALAQNRPHAVVLAHVIAHEIGHVLLRTNGHGRAGLMSQVWSNHEYARMTDGLLLFETDQARAMRRVVAGEACSPIAGQTAAR